MENDEKTRKLRRTYLDKMFPVSTCARVQELITAIETDCTSFQISAFDLERKGNIINLG